MIKNMARAEGQMQQITSLCKRRGFIYPGSEIYGGLANTWDYGPLGVELKNNIKRDWWRTFVSSKDEIYGMDGGILLNPKVWQASGHTTSFIDVLAECKVCHHRFREDFLEGNQKCPDCGGELTNPKKFVPMFKTFVGPAEETASIAYFRPETAQAIFINFKNIIDSFHPAVPFGIAQIGKAFRNEITLGNFIFRSLEFEQMEIEYFIDEKNWEKNFDLWKKRMEDWAVSLGIEKSKLRWRPHDKNELSHYSKRTEDLEYKFPFGFKELYGLAYRTDFDLRNHSRESGVDLSFQDLRTQEKFFPHVIEPSFGLERTLLAVLLEAYKEEKIKGETRTVLAINPQLSSYKVAVFPLLANQSSLVKKAKAIYENLKPCLTTAWDDIGNIGKRYRRQDEIGTPWCVTVDYETLKDNSVTVRNRDTMKQERIKTSKLVEYFQNKLRVCCDKSTACC